MATKAAKLTTIMVIMVASCTWPPAPHDGWPNVWPACTCKWTVSGTVYTQKPAPCCTQTSCASSNCWGSCSWRCTCDSRNVRSPSDGTRADLKVDNFCLFQPIRQYLTKHYITRWKEENSWFFRSLYCWWMWAWWWISDFFWVNFLRHKRHWNLGSTPHSFLKWFFTDLGCLYGLAHLGHLNNAAKANQV